MTTLINRVNIRVPYDLLFILFVLQLNFSITKRKCPNHIFRCGTFIRLFGIEIEDQIE